MRYAKLGAMLAALAIIATPAAAQFSDSYRFLKAVRDRDGQKVTEAVDEPGSTVVNTRDITTGEGALHIVVKRRDSAWLAFLLAKGARPDLRDNEGNTALLIAAQLGFVDAVELLLARRAGIDTPNSRGETPLILAVHNRDLAMVRALVGFGANPRLTDRIAGKSALDYAREDNRSIAIVKLLEETRPAKPAANVSGPTL